MLFVALVYKQVILTHHLPNHVVIIPSKGLLFHSDRGVQYASQEFKQLISMYGIKQSMSRKGNCWDNACAESLFKTIEELYRYSDLNIKII